VEKDPVNRRSYFPAGQTIAAKLKALALTLDARKGKEATDAWLEKVGVARDDLDDETRPMPLAKLHRSLQAFVEVASKDDLRAASDGFVAPEMLGAWMRVLRGTASPLEAFARLDGSESEYGRTTRWETITSGEGFWRGRVHIMHDPALEEDGLLNLARAAELAGVPMLFGYGKGEVTALEATGAKAEFDVRWSPPNPTRAAALGGGLGALAGSAMWLAPVSAMVGLGAMVTGGVAGALVAAARARDSLRRAESIAQQTRVNALERSMSLKEGREKVAAGDLEGSTVAGQYRLRKRMGSGASGVIYEAERISDGLPVAIKLLRAAAAHDAVASDRLRREAEALGLAWHPNVVEVIDHGHLPDGTAYLVMELLAGDSLSDRLKDKVRLTPRELLPIALQVCEALAAVHAAGVVHRDLKPSNIYLTKVETDAGVVERVKILDFGIARVEWEEMRITNMGSPLGTPGYMSPEQETGGEIDSRSDLFAVGAILYECLTGEPPPSTPSGLWRARVSERPRAADSGVHKATGMIPPLWKSVIERAMAQSPDDRYPDARALAAALRAVQGDGSQGEAGSG
jgi:serine/threonine-protein kinase